MKKIILIISFIVLGLFNQHAIADVVYVHNDALGSPIMESDANGAIIPGSHSHYKPFGETLEASKDDVGYTGHLNDSDLGLTYMQARYYDPVIGRFYSNDPVGFTGDITTFNRYSYVGNNPYTYTDPNGKTRWKIDAGIKIVGTIGGAFNLGFSFDDESFEISITAGGSGRFGAEAGTDLSFSTEPSSTKGNTADGKVTADLSIGTGEESIKVEGEYSSATGLDGNITLPSAIKVDANGVNLSPNIGASIGLGAQGTVNISIPDTINNISNAVSSAMNSVSEAANQCAANPGTSC
jgi:RHS repeat-associated protein